MENSEARINLTNLKKLSGGDAAFELKYINNFINAMPQQLGNIETALSNNKPDLLYKTLHLLKAQLGFYDIKGAFEEVKTTEQKLQGSPDITDEVKKSTNFIFKEIMLACTEFEAIKNSYL